MILLSQIVQTLVLSDDASFLFRFVGIECAQDCSFGAVLIDGHYLWFAVMAGGLMKEA